MLYRDAGLHVASSSPGEHAASCADTWLDTSLWPGSDQNDLACLLTGLLVIDQLLPSLWEPNVLSSHFQDWNMKIKHLTTISPFHPVSMTETQNWIVFTWHVMWLLAVHVLPYLLISRDGNTQMSERCRSGCEAAPWPAIILGIINLGRLLWPCGKVDACIDTDTNNINWHWPHKFFQIFTKSSTFPLGAGHIWNVLHLHWYISKILVIVSLELHAGWLRVTQQQTKSGYLRVNQKMRGWVREKLQWVGLYNS